MAEYGYIAILEESTSVYRLSVGLWSKESARKHRKDVKEMCKRYDVFFDGKYKDDFAEVIRRNRPTLGISSWKDFVPKVVRRIGAFLLGKL